jgi:hypothetical protein
MPSSSREQPVVSETVERHLKTNDTGIDLAVCAPATGSTTTVRVKTVKRGTPAGG